MFSISISNTDDQLRNHGFILTEKGWLLSPAFDVNPNESVTGLSLNISETSNDLDFDLALEVAEYFRLNKTKSQKIIKLTKEKVGAWESVAKKYNLSKAEIISMTKAFNRS